MVLTRVSYLNPGDGEKSLAAAALGNAKIVLKQYMEKHGMLIF